MINAIELKNVSKKYSEFSLDNINMTLPKGCIMGFIGENGAGKSTTIKLILDLIHREGGTIAIFGQDNLEKPQIWKERVGVVLDESSFHDALKLKEINLIMKNAYNTWDEDVFHNYTVCFSLSPKKTIKEYSRGMKMKLSIAVALSHNAELLILDEATSGLDPITRDEILDVFLEYIEDENHAIFMSSHIISDLEKICDYITFLHKGKIVFSQSKDDLLDSYGILKCSPKEFEQIEGSIVKGYRKTSFGVEALILKNRFKGSGIVDRATIEEIMLYYVKENV